MHGLVVTVIGVGVMGASAAYHLARRGVRVRVIDGHPQPSRGVSAHSFGWVNLINGDPATDPELYGLRRAAVAEFYRLARDLDGPRWHARCGSVVWRSTATDTEALIETHRVAGAPVERIDAARLRVIEPHLIAPPDQAAYAPEDGAVDVPALVERLLAGARAHDAEVLLGEDVESLQVRNGRLTGVTAGERTFATDLAILAAGTRTNALLRTCDVELPLSTSPSVLLRFASGQRFINGIVNSPDLELRRDARGVVHVAKGADTPLGHGERLAEAVAERIGSTFGSVGELRLLSVVRAERPMPTGRLPVAGFVPGLPGVYALVAHPGVILAPLLGSAVAQELISGQRDTRIGEWIGSPPPG